MCRTSVPGRLAHLAFGGGSRGHADCSGVGAVARAPLGGEPIGGDPGSGGQPGLSPQILHFAGHGVNYEGNGYLAFVREDSKGRLVGHDLPPPGSAAKPDPEYFADADALIDAMAQDKKVQAGKMRFILARALGDTFIADEVTAETLRPFLIAQGARG